MEVLTRLAGGTLLVTAYLFVTFRPTVSPLVLLRHGAFLLVLLGVVALARVLFTVWLARRAEGSTAALLAWSRPSVGSTLLGILGLGALLAVLWLLAKLTGQPVWIHPFLEEAIDASTAQLAILALVVCGFTPAGVELLLRGLLFGRALERGIAPWLVVLVGAGCDLLICLFRPGTGPLPMLTSLCLGLYLGSVRLRSGSTVLCAGLAVLASLVLLGPRLLAGPTGPARPLLLERDGIDRSYHGRFATDPRHRKLLEALPATTASAVQAMSERIGIAPADASRFVFGLRDAEPGNPTFAHTGTVWSFTGPRQAIVLMPDYLIPGLVDTELLVRHEVVHAIVQDRIPQERYQPLPGWFKEGLAVWASGELERAPTVRLSEALYDGRDPETLLDGLEIERGPYPDMLESGLFWLFLEERHGLEVVHTLVLGVVEGLPPRQAAEVATGEPWGNLAEAGRIQGSLRVEALLDEAGYARYQGAIEGLSTAGWAASQAELQRLAEERPGSWLAPNALFRLGSLQRAAGDHVAAARTLSTLVGAYRGQRHTLWASRYLLAHSLVAIDDCERAIPELQRYLEEHAMATPELVDQAARLLEDCHEAVEPRG